VRESFVNLKPLFHLAASNGNGKTVLMSTSHLSEVYTNVVLLERSALEGVGEVAPPQAAVLVLPVVGKVVEYSPHVNVQDGVYFRVLCPQRTALWWDMRKNGVTSTKGDAILKMYATFEAWRVFCPTPEAKQPHLGIPVVLIPEEGGDTTPMVGDVATRMRPEKYQSAKKVAEIFGGTVKAPLERSSCTRAH